MTVLSYPEWLRKYSVRLINQMKAPPLINLALFNLPKNSTLHYVGTDYDDIGILPTDNLLANHKENVAVGFITSYKDGLNKGNPISHTSNINDNINKYLQLTKFSYIDRNKHAADNERVLLVYNYGLLNRIYTYKENWEQTVFKWQNDFGTLVSKIADVAGESRQNFIVLNIPGMLPPPSLLNKASSQITQQVATSLGSMQLKFISEMWNWLGHMRGSSILSTLNVEQLNKINIVLVYGGVWTVLNLGVINSWRRGDDKDSRGPGFTKIEPDRLQKDFLFLLMRIHESATASPEVIIDETIEESASKNSGKNTGDNNSKGKSGGNRLSDYDFSIAGTTDKTGQYSGIAGKKSTPKTIVEIIKQGASDNLAKNDKEIIDEIGEIDDAGVDDDLSALDKLEEQFTTVTTGSGAYTAYTPPSDDPMVLLEEQAKEAVANRQLSAAEYRRIVKLSNKPNEIKNPFNGEGNLKEFSTIKPEDLQISEVNPLVDAIRGVTDSSMLNSSIKEMDRRYLKSIYKKDIVSSILNLQKAGVIVQDYNVEVVENALDKLEIHTVRLIPVVGKPTTIRFKLPVFAEDGLFKAGGVKYRMRRQKGDIPIRKTAYNIVALTSYYSKMFVRCSERMVFNYPEWLLNQIIGRAIDAGDDTVTSIRMNNVFNNKVTLPKSYTTISRKVSGFVSGGYVFDFDYSNRDNLLPKEQLAILKEIAKDKLFIPVGNYQQGILLIDFEDIIYEFNPTEKTITPKGTIEQILNIDVANKPIEVADIGIFGTDIPLGFVMAYYAGLGNLLATLKTKHRRVPIGSNYGLTNDEYIIKFSDEALILPRSDRKAALILGGFLRYHRDIKRYSIYSFDKKEVFANILEDNGLGSRYIREFKNMLHLWIDPITHGLLVEMKEPTYLFGLFESAVNKLLSDAHPDQMDEGYMRIKSHERISGILYFELIKAMRSYNSRPIASTASVDLNPEAVWMNIIQDQTVMPSEESNPIHALKETEVVVFAGAGGRTARSMTEKARIYHENSMGVISEATVDSGDVATITYLSADPNFNNIRGTSRRLNGEYKGKAAKLVSTSMLLAPSADRDDPKRVNFISIQNSQTTFCKGYMPLPVRTGYERAIAHRGSATFSKTAIDEGVVDTITPKVITVKYKNGETVSYELGRKFGAWAGNVVPHSIVTDLKIGTKLKKGDVICYNSNYFQKDSLDPSQIILKFGVLARTVLIETMDTIEDSSAISKSLAKRLVTEDTSIRTISIKFDQEIRNLLNVGEEVTPETILCTIHNKGDGNQDLFDEKALSTLATINTATPKADSKGVIEKIEVLYVGEIDEMSNTLRHLTEASDNATRKLNKALGGKAIDGRVEVGYRGDGKNPMEMDTAVIKVYITKDVSMKGGDKIVFANQMKSVTCRVMHGVFETEDGVELDAKFAQGSITNRIARSPEVIGTTSTLAIMITEAFIEAYDS